MSLLAPIDWTMRLVPGYQRGKEWLFGEGEQNVMPWDSTEYGTSDDIKRRSEAAYQQRAGLRDKGLEASAFKAKAAQDAVNQQIKQGKENLRQIDYRAAQNLALNAPSLGAGGGNVAAGADVAQEAAMQAIGQRDRDLRTLTSLRGAAANERLRDVEYQVQAGTRDSDYASTMSEAQAAIQAAIDERWGKANENSEIKKIIAKAWGTNPDVARALEAQYFGIA